MPPFWRFAFGEDGRFDRDLCAGFFQELRIPSSVEPVLMTSSTITAFFPFISGMSFSSRIRVCGSPVVMDRVSAWMASPM